LKTKFKIDIILLDFNELFSEMNEGFNRISTVINGLKNFSYIDKIQKRGRYDLNKGINDTLQILGNELKFTAKVIKNLSPLPEIECSGGEINQVLLNIILNAVQAIKSQQRKNPGTITVSTKEQDSFIICTIADDGPGIPGEITDKIFDPFFTTKEIGEGTGLGLNISNDIISKHNGELSVKNRKGGGAEFSIKLPVLLHLEEEVE
ncbi:MAG: ATP-binding protein, partial [Spirochaetia bacterium]